MGLSALWWWIDRWRKSSAFMQMTLEEQGAYRNLLDEATLRGGLLPNDQRILAKASGDATRWRKVRPRIMRHFALNPDGFLHNSTLDSVLAESARRAEKQRRYRERVGNADGNGHGNEAGYPYPYPYPYPLKSKKNKKNPPTPLKRGRVTRQDLKHAEQLRTRVYGGCPHTPRCDTADGCIRTIAAASRGNGQ